MPVVREQIKVIDVEQELEKLGELLKLLIRLINERFPA